MSITKTRPKELTKRQNGLKAGKMPGCDGTSPTKPAAPLHRLNFYPGAICARVAGNKKPVFNINSGDRA
jgi:hypothetical protein